MARLWRSISRELIPTDRQQLAAQFAQITNTTVVLKGAGTVVARGQDVYVNSTGNNGMATAGAGDVLTGVIVALLGQGLDTWDAAVLGTYLHGLAGDLAAQQKGPISLVASDIIDFLPQAFIATAGS
jgi:NAD(P)H-hydrate epimerase